MPVRVLLVDDVEEFRVVLRQALRLRGGFDVVAEAGDGKGAVTEAQRTRPDIVVLDLGLPDLAGREVLSQLRETVPAVQVVVLTGAEMAERSDLRDDVAAFITKDKNLDYVIGLLENVGRMPRSAACWLTAHPTSVFEARRFISVHCDNWRCGNDLTDDALLVTSELVTNAIVHAHAGVELRTSLAGEALRLEVIDAGSGTPEPQVASVDAEGGRGLLLVSALSAAWGVESLADGRKVVWAELTLPAG